MSWALFRVDASTTIGAGHWMRCLALADGLAQAGVEVVFVYRNTLDSCQSLAEQAGHRCVELAAASASTDTLPATDYAHSHWLDGGERADAEACLNWLAEPAVQAMGKPGWIIVDHYALASPWEQALAAIAPILVIDDLNDRPHQCRWLLDASADKTAEVYSDWIDAGCRLLLGPQYALLRPEFAQWREVSLARRHQPIDGPLKVLISLGGVDADNLTKAALSSLLPLADALSVEVIVGSSNPHITALRQWIAEHWPACQMHTQVNTMAQHLANADICIGAAGTSSWERCTLGVPTVLLLLAENQRHNARYLSDSGAAIALGQWSEQTAAQLTQALQTLLADTSRLQSLSDAAARQCDGLGVARVLQQLMPRPAAVAAATGRLREMTTEDLALVRQWRNHPQVRSAMYNQHQITPDEHQNWFAQAQADADRQLYIFEVEGRAQGFVQFQARPEDRAVWGFYMAPEAPKGLGRKLGRCALQHAFERLEYQHLEAEVLVTNDASLAFHRRLGFNAIAHKEVAGHEVACFELSAQQWLKRGQDVE
ncbi:UDP-2,4-diacetamido-2,4,6-trideoxy-beta-L-altropyranose hydrolase [Saccharospirillum sp. HFRX-1]|uniref:UDP-2,4-diacetamido-2,4, 6-trideoxy-beta-L-altropyranose hydrolase n=1 Tax=unclassified Saccharospirillum TaxID=2633430 RepID=UPI0037165717